MLVFSVVCIDLIGFGMILPLLPLYAQTYGASPFMIGLLAIAYSAGQLIFNPIWGAVSDKVGRRPVLLFSLLGASFFYALLGWAPTLLWLFVARIGAGICAANISAAMAYIADITTKENRTKGMGMIGAAFAIGFIIGPAIGGFLSKFGYSYPGYGAAAMSLCALTVAFFKLPESLKKQNATSKISFSYSEFLSPIIANLRKPKISRPVFTYFLVILSFSCMQITLPLFTAGVFNYDVQQNGYIFAFVGIVAVIFQGGLIGKLSQRFGEGRLAIVGIGFGLLGVVFLPFANTLAFLLLLMTLQGIGAGLNNPSLTGLISLAAEDNEQGTVLGTSRSVTTLARIIGPLWGGWAYGFLGMKLTYFSAGAVLLAAMFYARPLLRFQKASVEKI